MFQKLLQPIACFFRTVFHPFGKCLRDCRAVAALEFALVFPVAFASMFAVIEVARYHYIDSKLQEVVRSVARDQQAVFNKDERTALNATRIRAELETAAERYFGSEISMDDLYLQIKVYNSVSDYVDGNAESGENVVGEASQLVEYLVTYHWQSVTPYIDSLLSDDVKTLKAMKIIQNEP